MPHSESRRIRSRAWAPWLAALLVAGPSSASEAASNPSTTADALRRVGELIEFGAYGEAVDALMRAPGCARRESPECLVALASVRNRTRDFEAAVEDARTAIDLGPPADLAARAWLELGRARLGLAGPQHGREALRDAARACRLALRQDEAAVPEARFCVGEGLLRLGRTRKGLAQLERYLADEPDGTHAARSRWLIERPSCAREPCLPPFSVETTAGERMESRDLSGKVVLIEFWATWCPPCLEALPKLEDLGRRMSGKPFVALGINVDSNRQVLERYVERNGLSWPQYWDDGRRLSREMFGVRSFPTLVLADHRGIVRYSAIGWSAEIEAALGDELQALVEEAVIADRQD